MAVDPWGFDSERQALARRLRTRRTRLGFLRIVAFSLLAYALLAGLAADLRDKVMVPGLHPWASSAAYLVALFALVAAVGVPFAYVGGFRWEREFGLSRQTHSGWMKDLGKSLVLGLVGTLVVGGGLLWLLDRAPALWWLLAWALGLAASMGLTFLAPVLLVPMFYRLRPLRDPALQRRFEAIAAKSGVPVLGVFELEASAKTWRSNAAVMGFGRTRRVVVTDTLLEEFREEEIETILAHELAHQRYADSLRGFGERAVASLGLLAAVAWLYAAFHPTVGATAPSDPAGLPFLAVLAGLLSGLVRPIELRRSRRREARADRFAAEITGNPQAFATAIAKLHGRNLGLADPRTWEKWLFYSHPPGRERVEAARAVARAHERGTKSLY